MTQPLRGPRGGVVAHVIIVSPQSPWDLDLFRNNRKPAPHYVKGALKPASLSVRVSIIRMQKNIIYERC